MKKLQFDSGVKEYQVNDTGVLRFNPSDPNLFQRFLDAADEISTIEKDLTRGAGDGEQDGSWVIRAMAEADKKAKAVLTRVFGADNDFDQILGGVNLLAVGQNGERIITNLFEALLPILQDGAETCAHLCAEAILAERE